MFSMSMSVVIAMFLFFGGFIMAASSPMPTITSLLVFMVFWMRFISACSPPISLIFVMCSIFFFIFIIFLLGLLHEYGKKWRMHIENRQKCYSLRVMPDFLVFTRNVYSVVV